VSRGVGLRASRYRVIFSLVATRGFVMGTNFLTSLAIAYLCFSENSPGLFGYYAFVTSLSYFLPVMDLGVGQSIYNHFSRITVDFFSEREFQYYLRYLKRISISWIGLILAFYVGNHAINLPTGNLFNPSNNLEMITLSLIIYFLSIPLSAGFKLLNSIPRTELSLMLQSLTSPFTLLTMILGKTLHLETQKIVFIAPPLSFLLSNLINFLRLSIYLFFTI
jgi:hypothetical protein